MTYRQLTAAQLRVMIADIEPPIWRQLVVPLTWDLGMLHLVIQAAFNLWNSHLHEFQIGGLSYDDPDVINEFGSEEHRALAKTRSVCAISVAGRGLYSSTTMIPATIGITW